jgi:protein-disulfide isomerase
VVKAARVQPKSRTPFYILLLVAAVVGATGIWYSMQKAAPAPITLAPGTKLPDAEGYLIGRADAPVTIIEFGDFECPGCGQFANLQEPDVIKRIVEPGLASFRFYDFPLTEIHGNTMVAHLAASCANDQGKFWPMHDLIFKGQYDWNTQATREPRRVIDKYAEQVGLNMGTYDECMSTRKNLPKVEANKQAGVARGVGSTPTLVIGDRVYAGGLTYDQIRKIVDSTIAAMPATTLKPAPNADTSAKSTVPPKP